MISCEGFFGAGAADIRLGARAQAFGGGGAELDAPLGLGLGQRLGIGVGHDEVHAFEAGFDHVVDGIAAGAAHAQHGDAGTQFLGLGDFQVDRHLQFLLSDVCFGHLATRPRIAQLIRCYIVESFQPPAGQPAEPAFAVLPAAGRAASSGLRTSGGMRRAGHQKADGGGIVRPGRSRRPGPGKACGRPMRTCLFRMRAASSRVPASWQAPPVSTARRPAATS